MAYSESDTRANYIDPELKKSLWWAENIKREYYFTDGRKVLGNKRWARKFADYILFYKGFNLGIIEAKKRDLEVTEWLEQVKEYGKILHIRFVYSSNGKEIYEFDLKQWKWQKIEHFPTPDELYRKNFEEENRVKETLFQEPFFISQFKPRYYQEIAVNKTMEAIWDGQNRILLTLATWTGKTVIAFQMIYKLFMARWSLDGIGKRRPRILFLADRNVLVNQAMNTFNPLEKDIIKIDGKEIRKRNGRVPTNANIFFAIYQALVWGENYDDENMGNGNENVGYDCNRTLPKEENYFKRYPKDFFDMIVIDECHRWWAKQDGNWAEILQYFSPAVQVWLTATPKRDDNVDTYKYFWKPVYEYSLKAWIDDGFLTPFKIKRIKLNIDELVLNSGDEILQGEAKKDVYSTKDMERNIVIEERSDLIASTIINQINPMDKTIIFCVDQAHALRMRDSINKYKTIKDPDYCVRVTSDEGDIWTTFLEKFQDNDNDIPVILTSSQMLTTGVDAKNVRNIVLVRNIWSIVEYKQIVWRGTRVFEWKDFFTIYDFVWATNEFRDELWDGGPEEENVVEDEEKKKGNAGYDCNRTVPEKEDTEPKEKLKVRLAPNREVKVIDIETRYLDPVSGKHLNSEDFLKKIIGELPDFYKDEHQLRMLWADPKTRQDLLESFSHIGLDEEQFEDLKKMFHAEGSDIFDILAHLSFDLDIKYRQERYDYGIGIIEKYESLKAKEFLEFLLGLYVKNGILDFRKDNLSSKIALFNKWEVREIAEEFWGIAELQNAYLELQKGIYEVV